MPPKRKAQVESPVDESKRIKPNVEESNNEELDLNCPKVYRQVFDHVTSQTDSEDRSLSEMFDVLPSKSEFPIYYDIIEEPIDFKTIKKRILSKHYESFEDFEHDVLLLIKNAYTFNEPRSQISKDATILKRAFHSKKQELSKPATKLGRKRAKSRTMSVDSEISEEPIKDDTLGSPRTESEDSMDAKVVPKQSLPPIPKPEFISSPANTPTYNSPKYVAQDDGLIDQNFEHNAFSVLYNTVCAYTDAGGRRLAQPFLRLPNKRCYPEYYELIKRPLSLTKTRTKIKQNYYTDIHVLGKDLCVLFENAMQYNKPGSGLYNDAMFLKGFTMEKKEELAATAEYLERKETMSNKRGRTKVAKIEDGDAQTPVASKRGRGKQKENNLSELSTPDGSADKKSLKKRLMQMYNCVAENKDSEGRLLCEMFQELPDKEDYPDYYKVIPHPLDMKTILSKIQALEYTSEEQFIQDFEIMFQNARHYNEEGSEVYNDSVTLEKSLRKKRRWLTHLSENKSPMKGPRSSNSPSLPVLLGKRPGEFGNKCHELLYHVRSHVDENGRSLSEIFERLPSRMEYPDYYLLIKKPIDLNYISTRLNKYTTLEDFEQDMLLLFNNACQYNDPDSQIYKDALTLLRVMLEKKKAIVQDDQAPLPNVPAMVQSLLHLLYTNVINHKDEEGRLYADSLLEIEVTLDTEDGTRKPISLPVIGQLLKLGFYKRVDRLQDDMFSIFEKARKEGRTDSEIYEDSCELQTRFILERDRLTKDGLRLMTQAMNSIQKKVQNEIDAERKEKQQNESHGTEDDDDEEEEDNSSKKINKTRFKGVTAIEVQPEEETLIFTQSVTVQGVVYNVGDFVYVTPEETNRPPHLMSIEKIWMQKDGLQGIWGSWFYRPEATFHLASRKFMERELFRSYHSSFILFSGVVGRCYVMSVKEYPKTKPQGFADEDVYVCESRYNGKTKTFKKLKTFPPTPSHVNMVARDEPIMIKRVSSVFNPTGAGGTGVDTATSEGDKKGDPETSPSSQEMLTTSEGYEYPREKNCEMEVSNPNPGCTYYEKYVTDSDVFKIGDGVYVRADEDYLRIAKIERIWTTEQGVAFCHCIMFVLPEDTKNMPTQLFSENECFESNVEEDLEISRIRGKCSVLNLRDYQLCRPTEFDEKDIYLCTATYNEDEMKFRRNIRGCKRLQLPQNIRDDEYWYFDQQYNPRRRPSLWLMSTKGSEKIQEIETDDQNDDQNVDMEKIGFALFKKELVTAVMRATPNMPVVELDRLSDEKWKSLSDEQQKEFKERAKRQGLGENLYIYECAWSSCEHQYENLQDLMVHVIEGPHLVRCPETGSFPCKWKECERQEKGLKSLKTHSQLVRHIRETHFKSSNRTKIIASDKTKFYFPAHQACEDSFRDGSETSSRTSVTSPLSPRVPPPNGHHFPPNFNQGNMPIPNSPGAMMNMGGGNPLQMQAGMYPPFRMNGQPQNSAALLMQQQIYQQQQQMMMQAARGRPMPPLHPHHSQGGPRGAMPTTPNNHMMQQQPPTPQGAPQQPMVLQQPPTSQAHQQNAGVPGVPPPPHGLTPDQQQMLLIQVQQQQHQIMKLQEQVKSLSSTAQQQHLQQQQQQAKPPTPPADKAPVFVAPPSTNATKVRHSKAYLRYIEGLRDDQGKMSNWGTMADLPNKPKPSTGQLPVHWLNDNHGYKSSTEALWALRDHMLKDSITLSKFT